MQHKIQRVELNRFYSQSIYCPFCGEPVLPNDEKGTVAPCKHTLFVAHDDGFEFRHKRFDENLGIAGIDEDDIAFSEDGYDEVTDKVTLPDAVKFAAYVGAPSGFGTYVGFAPTED